MCYKHVLLHITSITDKHVFCKVFRVIVFGQKACKINLFLKIHQKLIVMSHNRLERSLKKERECSGIGLIYKMYFDNIVGYCLAIEKHARCMLPN